MATTPTMGRPAVGRPTDTPDEVTKRRLYWGVALAVLVLVAIGLAMRNRNRVTAVSTVAPDTTYSAPADTGTTTPSGTPTDGTGTTTPSQ